MVEACIRALCDVTKNRKDVVILGSDYLNIGERTDVEAPGQYIEMGIAENNLIGAAAGVASAGIIPFVYAVSPFIVYRAIEFIRDDICLQNRNVKIIGYSAGMDYCTSGPTHHTTEDIAILRVMPNLTILSPASVKETEEMVRAAVDIDGPVYIRLNRERNREIHKDRYYFKFNSGEVICQGEDVAIISTGAFTYDAIKVAEYAKEKGVDVEVLHLGTLKPLDVDTILKTCRKVKKVITIEEHNILGGLGGSIAEIMAENALGVPLIRIGLNDCFAKGYGNHDEMKEQNGMSIDDILIEVCK